MRFKVESNPDPSQKNHGSFPTGPAILVALWWLFPYYSCGQAPFSQANHLYSLYSTWPIFPLLNYQEVFQISNKYTHKCKTYSEMTNTKSNCKLSFPNKKSKMSLQEHIKLHGVCLKIWCTIMLPYAPHYCKISNTPKSHIVACLYPIIFHYVSPSCIHKMVGSASIVHSMVPKKRSTSISISISLNGTYFDPVSIIIPWTCSRCVPAFIGPCYIRNTTEVPTVDRHLTTGVVAAF